MAHDKKSGKDKPENGKNVEQLTDEELGEVAGGTPEPPIPSCLPVLPLPVTPCRPALPL